jgi:hypothetical protein
MGSFTSFTKRSFPKLAKTPVQDIAAGTMFFLSRSRNAWHSTWASHYFPGCMHATLEGAQAAAEKLRACGSVFTIEEQPTLFLLTPEGVAGVTEINSKRPLESFDRVIDQYATWMTPSPLRPGNSVDEYVKFFTGISQYWRPAADWKNLVVVATRTQHLIIQPLRKRNLRDWISRPQGSQYSLAWEQSLSGIKPSAVLALARWTMEPSPTNQQCREPTSISAGVAARP